MFTRKIGTCSSDDVYPAGPRGASVILCNYDDGFTFSEYGVQRYKVADVDFSNAAENAGRTPGEPKFYHFRGYRAWDPFKDEVFVYRSPVLPSPITVDAFEQLFRTVCYGIRWETFSEQVSMIEEAIERETNLPGLQNIKIALFEWLDGMRGLVKNDQYNYGEEEEEEDE